MAFYLLHNYMDFIEKIYPIIITLLNKLIIISILNKKNTNPCKICIFLYEQFIPCKLSFSLNPTVFVLVDINNSYTRN